MEEKILEVAPQSVELTYKAFFQYTTPSFEDALLEALEEVIPNKEKVKQDSGITEEVFYIPIPMGVIYPEETIEKQPNESLLEIPKGQSKTNVADKQTVRILGNQLIWKSDTSWTVPFIIESEGLQSLTNVDIQAKKSEPEHLRRIEQSEEVSEMFVYMEKPTIEPKVIHKVQEKNVDAFKQFIPQVQPEFVDRVNRSEMARLLPYPAPETSVPFEGFYESSDFSDSPKVKEDLQLGRETLKNFPEINYREQKAKEEQNKPILTPGGFEEPQRQDKISFTKAQILLDEFPQKDPPQVKVLVYADEEKEGEKKHMADRESPDLILTDGHSRSVKPQIDKAQQVERIERPQATYFHEPKRVNLHLEEGSVKFTLFGDRLRLFINLREDFYGEPTALDVQRLVQSLQNLGLNLELLRLNGSNLYSSDHRQGSKRDTKEKLSNPSISELSEDVKRSFSLYL